MMNNVFAIFLVIVAAASAHVLRFHYEKPVLRNCAMLGLALGVLMMVIFPVEFFCHCGVWYHHFLNLVLTWLLCAVLAYAAGKIRR